MEAPPEDSARTLGRKEIEYINKIQWLWSRLTSEQRSRIRSSMVNNTLRQENSRQCFIGQATGMSRKEDMRDGSLIFRIANMLKDAMFYDGPSYRRLLGRTATAQEKMILDDIYYAKIGTSGHQYQRANELIRYYLPTACRRYSIQTGAEPHLGRV